MALYRNISLSFWTDSKVDDEFTPEDKYFYLYLLTNPHTNICGCYEISTKQMERETGYNEDTIKRLLKRLEKEHNVIRYDNKTKEVLIINWSKYNWTASEKVTKAVLKVAEFIKSEKFKKIIFDLINNNININNIYTILQITDTDTDTDTDVCIGYTYPIHTVSDTADKSASAPAKKEPLKFQKPKIEEIEAYCKERGNNIDATKFFNYYESNGWRVGKNPMKNWKAAVRTWEQNNYDNDRQQAQTYQRPTADDYDLSSLFE